MRPVVAIGCAPRTVRAPTTRARARPRANVDRLLLFGRAVSAIFEFDPTPRPDAHGRRVRRSDWPVRPRSGKVFAQDLNGPWQLPISVWFAPFPPPLDDAAVRRRKNDHQETFSWPEP